MYVTTIYWLSPCFMGRNEDPSDPGPQGPQTPGSSSGISCRRPPAIAMGVSPKVGPGKWWFHGKNHGIYSWYSWFVIARLYSIGNCNYSYTYIYIYNGFINQLTPGGLDFVTADLQPQNKMDWHGEGIHVGLTTNAINLQRLDDSWNTYWVLSSAKNIRQSGSSSEDGKSNIFKTGYIKMRIWCTNGTLSKLPSKPGKFTYRFLGCLACCHVTTSRNAFGWSENWVSYFQIAIKKWGNWWSRVRFPSFSPFCPHFLMDIKSGRNFSLLFPSFSEARPSPSAAPPVSATASEGRRRSLSSEAMVADPRICRWGSWRSGGNSIGTWISPRFSGPWAPGHTYTDQVTMSLALLAD